MTKNKKLIISCILIFIFALFLRVHFIGIKQGLHADEIFSINASNYSPYGLAMYYPEYKWYTGKELKKMSLYDDASIKDTISDLKKLHKNTYDPPHTNLYYSALRTWFTGFTNTDLKPIIWRGCSLNLLFFSLSFFIMYKILRRFFKDSILVPFGLLAAFANTGTISNTLFMRPYQIQETVFLLLVLTVINFWDDIEKKQFLTVKNGIICSVVLGLTLLTGYLAPFYIGLLSLPLIYNSVKEKQNKNILVLFGSFVLAVLFAWICYLSYFNGFISNRAEEVLAENVFLNTKLLKEILSSFVYYLYYPPCIILSIVLGIRLIITRAKFNLPKTFYYAFICTVLWSIITMIAVPYKVIRYIFPVLPLLSLAFPMLVSAFKGKEKKLYIILFSIIFVFCGLFPQAVESSDTKYPPAKKLFPGQSRIQNLFITQKLCYPYSYEPNVPVYIQSHDSHLILLNLVPAMNDNQHYFITYDEIPIQTNLPEAYLVYDIKTKTDREVLKPFYNIIEIPSEQRLRTIKLVHR